MTTAVIELHDVALRCGTGSQLIEVPGHALVTPQGIVTGAAARARAWREPQHSFDQYWHQLGTAALPVVSRHARHFADLAHAQLLALHQAAGAPPRVIFAVPGSFGRDQLAVLLGIAQAAPFGVAGLIDAALAAAHTEVADAALHLDLLRHCAVLTRLRRSGAEVLRERVAVLPELGLNRLHELWARHLAERFIAAHRYDPLHTGSGEQALREALPGWLATLARQRELNAVLPGPRGPLHRAGRDAPTDQLTTKLTRMFTRHSVTVPASSVTTLMSLTQAPLMFLTLLATFLRPPCTASSMLFLEEDETSITLVTVAVAMIFSWRKPGTGPTDYTPGPASRAP